VASFLDGRDVDEHLSPAALRLDESIALHWIEPLHCAFDFAGNGRTVTNLEATQMLYSGYPSQVRRWISRRGGLTPRMIFLGGKQLQAM
jgi:hypothetical protein